MSSLPLDTDVWRAGHSVPNPSPTRCPPKHSHGKAYIASRAKRRIENRTTRGPAIVSENRFGGYNEVVSGESRSCGNRREVSDGYAGFGEFRSIRG